MIQRNTIQKTLILNTVNDMRSHVTADEVYDEVVKAHPSISKGTVYRNLNQLVQNGEIKKIEVPSGADRFDYRCFEHYHVKCLKCGGIFDVEMDAVKNLERNIKDAQGFEFSGYDIMFKGICPTCKI